MTTNVIEVVLVREPTPKEASEGKVGVIVFGPKAYALSDKSTNTAVVAAVADAIAEGIDVKGAEPRTRFFG